MRKPILLTLLAAVVLLGLGMKPRYIEELRIGGGLDSPPDGGADFAADGDIATNGSLEVDGPATFRGTVMRHGELNDASLVGYWPLNEGAGTTIHDASTYGNDGAATLGAGAWSDDSPFRSSLYTNDSTINCGSADSLDDIECATYVAWIKADTYGGGGEGRLFDKDPGTIPTEHEFRLNAAQTCLELRMRFSGTSGRWRSPTGSVPLGRWTLVAATYDRRSVANDPVFYVNGQPVAASRIAAPVGTAVSDAADALRIANNAGGARDFEGRLCELRLYRRILSAEELQSLYRAPTESPALLALSVSGNVAVGGDASVAGGDFTLGTDGSVRGYATLWDGSGGSAPGCLRLGSPNGTLWYLFVEDDGTVKIHNALPTSNGNGTVVGTQL